MRILLPFYRNVETIKLNNSSKTLNQERSSVIVRILFKLFISQMESLIHREANLLVHVLELVSKTKKKVSLLFISANYFSNFLRTKEEGMK